jgi:uncharacterized protein
MAAREAVSFPSLGEELAGMIFLPDSNAAAPVLVVCHGAGEFKENYFEMCDLLASQGIAALAIDMHGHGRSGGKRFHVNMHEWVADVRAAVEYLQKHPAIDRERIGAFGLSSGGTAILEAAMVEPRLKTLVALTATVRNSMPWPMTMFLRLIAWLGWIKWKLTGRDLRVPLARLPGGLKVAADPDIERKLHADQRLREAYLAFPFPGASEAFFVNTLRRVKRILVPTLILWGAEDEMDPPETARLLYAALTCRKELYIIPGNGHVGHLDRNRHEVFALTAAWVRKILG